MDDAALDRYAEALHEERSRLAAGAGDRPGFTVETWEDRPEKLKARDRAMVAVVAEMAAADERERIAALADLVGAIYDEDGDGVPGPFGDLIREEPS